MAKVQVLGQRCPHGDKMLIRGVFTQKKILWESIFNLMTGVTLELRDDLTGNVSPSTYNGLCNSLRKTGRATLVGEDGKAVFQVVDALTNELRDWDVDEEGDPICNPVTK
jgi:hypothetical protein